tara:strand:- start:430 stop:1071 length:642 start_codon:yes stop_codon:yes gene_type:complete
MSVIFPGNYVSHLNAYREQGVEALPGIEFYRIVGALVLNPDTAGVTSSGTLASGTYGLKILSPDLRQDDKPRTDKTFEIPAGSVVYRTALSAPGVKANASGDTIKIVALGSNAPGDTGSEVTLTAAADLFYPAEGATSALLSILDGTAVNASAATAVQVITSAANTAEQNPSVGADRKSPSAILVEVCYYRAASAPDAEDAHVPYGIEAGQGT